MRTGALSLLRWVEHPPGGTGVRFAGAKDTWDIWTYRDLATLVRRNAAGLQAAGVRPGQAVVLVQQGSPEFVGGFFGALMVGAVPSPAAPPLAFQDGDEYLAHLRRILSSVRPSVVLVEPGLESIASKANPLPSTVVVDATTMPTATPGKVPASWPGEVRPDEEPLGIIQFTSGSSGRARGIRVRRSALEANLAAMSSWLEVTPGDSMASWLPVYHDMGMIGCFLVAVTRGLDLQLFQPQQFVRTPLRYLHCFDRGGATITAMPNFGLEHLLRRVRTGHEGLDLSGWRRLVLGAERIEPRTVRKFAAWLAPTGFSPRSFAPAYGLAEATLAVSGLAVGRAPTVLAVEAASTAMGAKIRPATAARDAADAEATMDLVGCGTALEGVEVAVVDDDGKEVEPGRVGMLRVGGRCVADGYLPAPGTGPSSTAIADGRVLTGDAGFLHDGEVFVLGRIGDALKVRGRTVFAEDLEALAASVGVRRERAAAVLGVHRGHPTALVLVEGGMLPEREEALLRLIAPRVGDADLAVIDVAPKTIPRTSSGKPKRRLLWDLWENGALVVRTPR